MNFRWVRDYADYFYLGLMLPSALIVGTGFGYLIDKYFHTDPWGKLIGILFGFAAGVVNFIRDYQRLTSKKK